MFLSIDIGGSFTRIALSADGNKIDEKLKYPTPKKYDDGIDLLEEKIEEITEGKTPKAISVAAASPINYIKGTLIRPPNLPNWLGHSLQKELELRIRTKVYLENDGMLGGLGEASKRKKSKILGFITLSTGVGGVRIVDGKIDRHSLPSEPGHQILDPNGRYWPGCGQKGCFESLCSGKAFEMTYGVKPEFCEDYRIWEEHAENCAQGLVNVITLWTPDTLVIGGSLIKAGPKFTGPLVENTKNLLKIYSAPKIEFSKMGDDNVLLGGLIQLKQKAHLNQEKTI
jgi:predicted NBD/HSP70 family sugar kinase